MKKFNIALIIGSFLFLTLNQSCTKQDNPIAPELPPSASFLMEMNGFEDSDTTKSFTNWFYAAVNVVYWNSVVEIVMAVPTASFKEAFNHEALYQGDLTWKWHYSVTVDGLTYTAELIGKKLSSEEVQWDMYVSQQNGFTDFHYYSGIVRIDHTAASWKLFKNVANVSADMLAIDYRKDASNGTAQITYTNIEENSADNGAYISFGSQTDYLNIFYHIYQKKADNLTEIEANKNNKDGRVRDPKQFNDEEWHCWNTDRWNMACE